MSGRSWTPSSHLFSRLYAVQPFLGPIQPGRLTLRKISRPNTGATRCHNLRIKCTKLDLAWGSAPDPTGSVREYVFFVFFQISKKHYFLRFFEMTLKKRKKSVAKILSSMMLTLLEKKKKFVECL